MDRNLSQQSDEMDLAAERRRASGMRWAGGILIVLGLIRFGGGTNGSMQMALAFVLFQLARTTDELTELKDELLP